MKTIILDPGHGMSNRNRGIYDPGTVFAGIQEATIAMAFVNELRRILIARGKRVIRTRVDANDPAPVSRRDDIAGSYGGDIMLSFHCNAGGGTGCEVFYRGADDKAFAMKLSATIAATMGIRDRGAKTEAQSQHASLAVMEFDKCWLIELGFLDHAGDRAKMLDSDLRQKVCEAIASLIP